MALLLRLADDLDNLSPFYEEPQMFNIMEWPRQNYWNRLNRLSQALQQRPASSSAVSQIGKDGFQVSMDVTQFKPSELNVKVVDNSVVVEGKHEEREDDHGFISRHFVRRYALPKGYDADKVQSTLSSDGVLTVSIPKPQLEDKSNERHIQIQQTGPAHLNVKENATDDKEKDKAKVKAKK